MKIVARALLTFQNFNFATKNTYLHHQIQMVRAFSMNLNIGASSPHQVKTLFVSKTSTLSQEYPFWM